MIASFHIPLNMFTITLSFGATQPELLTAPAHKTDEQNKTPL
jgi:hypothetical protein